MKKKKSTAEEQQKYEMLTVFCYIALDSLESAAKRVVLMKNMSDAVSRAALDVESTSETTFKQRGQKFTL